MRAGVFMARDRFAHLRRRIAEIEGQPAGLAAGSSSPFPSWEGALRLTSHQEARTAEDRTGMNDGELGARGEGEQHPPKRAPAFAPRRARPLLPFAIPDLDRRLAGGLRRDALHEIRSTVSRDAAAATGFAAAVLARLAETDDRPILWIAETAATREAGLPYGRGLDRFGLDPRRLIVVRVAKPAEALWVCEEGLSCRGLAAVLVEIRGEPRLLDLTASRRLALRARACGVMGLMLRQTGYPAPSAAATRWVVAPLPAATLDDYPAGIGRPAWRLVLERNRAGATGVCDVEWDHGRHRFAIAAATASAAHLVPVAAVSSDRPPPPTDARPRVA